MELIKKTIEISNTDAWPALQQNQKQQQMTSTIVLLALLEENSNPGIFQNKLGQQLQKNSLPSVKYELELNTTRDITNIFCAANHNIILTPANILTPTQTPASDTSTHTATASGNTTRIAALSSIASGTTTHTH